MHMAEACVLRGAALIVCVLLLLSSSFIAAEPAGRQWDHGRKATVAAMTMATGRFVRKVLREEMIQAHYRTRGLCLRPRAVGIGPQAVGIGLCLRLSSA